MLFQIFHSQVPPFLEIVVQPTPSHDQFHNVGIVSALGHLFVIILIIKPFLFSLPKYIIQHKFCTMKMFSRFLILNKTLNSAHV